MIVFYRLFCNIIIDLEHRSPSVYIAAVIEDSALISMLIVCTESVDNIVTYLAD